MESVLIVGQGLAGTALAWRLWQRGVRFLIVDPNEADTCSKVAAGLITPITGMRLNLSWRVAGLLPEATAFYRELEGRLGAGFYHEVPHVRLFKEMREVKLWEKRRDQPDFIPWIEREDDLADTARFHAELGGFQQRGSGWLNTAVYLEASRQFFFQHQCLQQDRVEEAELQFMNHEVRWRDAGFSHAVLCRGWEQSQSRYFPWLPFDAARGIIVELEADLPKLPRIYNRGGWILPCGDGRWRAGSTYEFDFQRPLEDSLEDLQHKLQNLLRVPFTMSRPRAGVRPILKRLPAVLGSHPVHRRLAVFNGLGSKGAMKSPLLSRLLMEHLLDHTLLDEALDVCSNAV